MANQYVNKVIIGKEVKLDLTADSVTPDKLAKGITAHDKTGAPITGTIRRGSRPSKKLWKALLGAWAMSRSIRASSFSSYSPRAWSTSWHIPIFSRFTVSAPVEALDASTRSSVSFFSRWDFRSSTSMYSRALGFSTSSIFRRLT